MKAVSPSCLRGDTDESERSITLRDDLQAEAVAVRDMVVMMRRAQGKNIPSDCPDGSIEWIAVATEFAEDVQRVITGRGLNS